MKAIKILPKGQITLPKEIRKTMNIKEGDTLLIENTGGEIVMRKGKTIFDYAGALPNTGLSIDELRERAIEETLKDHD